MRFILQTQSTQLAYLNDKTHTHLLYSIFYNTYSFLILASILLFLVNGVTLMHTPIDTLETEAISLSITKLPYYTFRTLFRMFIGIMISIIVSLIIGIIAAKNTKIERILIPLLDILQSVPILGYTSFAVIILVSKFPNSVFGLECAAIFGFFTSQFWNILFGFYYSIKRIPDSFYKVSKALRLSAFKQFFIIELPYCAPDIIWNIPVSMSGGWFFVVVSEVISVGNTSSSLPGVGSYIALALKKSDNFAIIYSIFAILIAILLYNYIIINPISAWAKKFSTSRDALSNKSSYIYYILNNSAIVKVIYRIIYSIYSILIFPIIFLLYYIRSIRYKFKYNVSKSALNYNADFYSINRINWKYKKSLINYLWYLFLILFLAIFIHKVIILCDEKILLEDITLVIKLCFITLIRIFIVTILVTLFWMPVGIYVGLNPILSSKIQPFLQLLASFPSNILFPIAVIIITKYKLNPVIWLSPMLIVGSQWYILFSIISGASSLPKELMYIIENLKISRVTTFTKIIAPAIMPHLISGIMIGVGGAWNASIISEIIQYGDTVISTDGVGKYIAEMTLKGDFYRIMIGILCMSITVAIVNTLIWQPVYKNALKTYKI